MSLRSPPARPRRRPERERRALRGSFNLSEYSHVSKFNRLTGGDPNYVGYKEGGELTNFVRQAEDRRAKRLGSGPSHTSCVILFDEVDRAADGLLTYLMNFLDQGQLTDGRGEMVDASRAVVLMTTNCGREAIAAEQPTCAGGSAAAARRATSSSWRRTTAARPLPASGRKGTTKPRRPRFSHRPSHT